MENEPNENSTNLINLSGYDVVEQIDLTKLKPYNDPNCTHPVVVPDQDELGKAYKCLKCNLGWIVK